MSDKTAIILTGNTILARREREDTFQPIGTFSGCDEHGYMMNCPVGALPVWTKLKDSIEDFAITRMSENP